MLPETDQAGADVAAERLRAAVRDVPMFAGAVQWTGGSAEGLVSRARWVAARARTRPPPLAEPLLDVRGGRHPPPPPLRGCARAGVHSARSAGGSGAPAAAQQGLVEQDRVVRSAPSRRARAGRGPRSRHRAQRALGTMRRYAPGREACAKRLTIGGSPIRRPSLKQGSRGWQTSSIDGADPPALADEARRQVEALGGQVLAEGARRRASRRARPPSTPRPRGVRVDGLVRPPCTRRSAWSSPSTLTPATRTRPSTGALPIALISGRPRRTESWGGRPTFTENNRATSGRA